MLGPGFEIQLHNALQERNRELALNSLMKNTLLQQRRLERNARIRLKIGSAMIAMGNRIHRTTEHSGAQAEPASP
jgi:hypothetical protein